MSSRPRILAVDCATLPASVAALEGAEETCSRFHDDDRRADAWLGVAIEECLAESGFGIGELHGLATSVGPGTFTGIRVGIATCLGLAAPRGLPVAGVRTLDALAAQHRSDSATLAACLDARRGQVYAALYAPRPETDTLPMPTTWGPAVCAPEELAARLGDVCGPVVLCGNGASLLDEYGDFDVADTLGPLAPAIGSLAAACWPNRNQPPEWPPATPVYLRPPDARPPRNPLTGKPLRAPR